MLVNLLGITAYFDFHANHCIIKSHETYEVLLHGQVSSGALYEFLSICLQPAKSLACILLNSSFSVFTLNSVPEHTTLSCNT